MSTVKSTTLIGEDTDPHVLLLHYIDIKTDRRTLCRHHTRPRPYYALHALTGRGASVESVVRTGRSVVGAW